MRVKSRVGKFATIRQLEQEFAIPYLRIWEWIRTGQLPHLEGGVKRRSYLVRRTDFEKFIAARITEARS